MDLLQCWDTNGALGGPSAFAFQGVPTVMTRIPRRYCIHLLLSSGKEELVHFPTLEAFQQWYTSAQIGRAHV